MTRCLTILTFAWFAAVSLAADDNEGSSVARPDSGAPSSLRALHIDTDLVRIDGVLSEPVWSRAESLKIVWETWPGDNRSAKASAEGWVAYDSRNLYVAFKAYDPDPSRIRARYTDRDGAFADDYIGVVLDTFNDERRAFEFFVNPLGVQMDLTQDDVGGGEDDSWDALWNSAGRITEFGYVVEIAIPFSSLRFARTDDAQTWGIDMMRIYPRDQRYVFRAQHQDRNRACNLCQISKLEGLEGLEQGRSIELDPTMTAQRTDVRSEDGLTSGEVDTQFGLSGKWGFTPNLTLNLALNPDFSQIEADAAQLDINNQFALFFPEKRTFFLEGSDFFNTPFDAVYTRTVADPDWGMKVTGKEGVSAIGAYVSGDSVTNLLLPGSTGSRLTSIDEENVATVLRYRYDLGERSTVGVLYTGREGSGEYSNRAGGIDAYWRANEKDTFTGQVLFSSTNYPDALAEDFAQPSGTFDDSALFVRYRHSDRDWFWQAWYEEVGEHFRADSGFMPQVDYKLSLVGLERKVTGTSDSFLSRGLFGGQVRYTEDQSGQKLTLDYQGYSTMNFAKQTYVFLNGGARDRFFNGVMFDETFFRIYVETRPTASLFLSLDTRLGDQIDFANTRLGARVYLSPGLTWKAGRRTELSLSHTYSTLDVDGGQLFEANLTELRAVYQINLRMFVRAILQYTDIARNPALYDRPIDAKSEQLFPQFLFSYKLNPQTVFFVGYSDNREADDTNVDLIQRDRTFFTKIGYAWVF